MKSKRQLRSSSGRGLVTRVREFEFYSNLMENNEKVWGKEMFIMCLRELNLLSL